jgi:hypothetical protein
MDPIQFPESFDEFSIDDLTALRAAAYTALTALFDAESHSDDEVAEAKRLGAGLKAIDAETAKREAAAAERAEALAALKAEFSESPAEDEAEEGDAEAEGEDEEEEEAEAEAEEVEVAAAAKPKARAALARKASRPAKPAPVKTPVQITAQPDVPGFSASQALTDMTEVATAVVNRMRGFGTPSGNGETESLQHYGVAQFKMDFPDELTIKPHDDDMKVLNYAANEARLVSEQGSGSLTAAGGWCAPSETLYDLCVLESMDGLLSLPEVNVARGGIKFTKGPQWSDIYGNIGFTQTETQAIAGTTKSCYEVTCPSFTEVRLDAVGVCIKVPILTNAAYPEVVNRILSGAMVVHAHRVNNYILGKMETAAGSAFSAIDYGASTESTMASLALVAGIQRTKYKMALNETMEVVLPYWVKDVLREDLAQRGGRPLQAVTDNFIMAEFSARGMRPQFVYDWQELATDGSLSGWPSTYKVLMYPAGTFVKGTSDVITLNAVYDAASLATNVYTALFFEEGILVANLCNEARLITVPTCASGKTGAQTATVCAADS